MFNFFPRYCFWPVFWISEFPPALYHCSFVKAPFQNRCEPSNEHLTICSWVQKILETNYPAPENNSSSLAQMLEELKRATEWRELKPPVQCPLEFLPFFLSFLITIELQPVAFKNHSQGEECSTISASALLRQCWHIVFVRRRPALENKAVFFSPWQLRFLLS